MFARIRKIIDLTKFCLKEETVPSKTRPEILVEKKEGGTVRLPNVDENLEDGPDGLLEMKMKEKIVMIHILRNWMMTPRWTRYRSTDHIVLAGITKQRDLFCKLFALSRNNIEFVIVWLVVSLVLVLVLCWDPSITLRRNKGEVTQSSRKWPRYICKTEWWWWSWWSRWWYKQLAAALSCSEIT